MERHPICPKKTHEKKTAARKNVGFHGFAKWFEDFRAEQELLLRWDETIGEDDED